MASNSKAFNADPPTVVAMLAAAFRENPRLRLTQAQAQRLWHLSPQQCGDALTDLIRQGRLQRDRTGQYGVPPEPARPTGSTAGNRGGLK